MSDQASNIKATANFTPASSGPAFLEKNKKKILLAIAAVGLIVGGWYIYKFYKASQEEKANDASFQAIRAFDGMANTGFNKDSIDLVIKGGNFDGSKITGLLDFVKKHAGTQQANLAKYALGCCYLNTKNYDEAIKYLKEFDAGDALQVKSRTLLMLGHAYAGKNQVSEAMNHYKLATEASPKDEVMTADALYWLANYQETNNNSTEAISNFKKLRNEYPNYQFVQNKEVDKRLARLGELN